MIPWLTPYAGIWAMTEPCARLMSIKLSALVHQSLTVEQFARLQADARPAVDAKAWPEFVTVHDDIAVLTMCGVLSKERLLSGPPSLPEYASAIHRIAADGSIHTLLLKIDSPGGSIAGLDAVAAAVRAAQARMRTIAFVDDCACSAAYWIASQAGEIATNPTATVGSIGAFAVLVDSSAAAKRDGFEVLVFGSGGLKGLAEAGTSLDEAQRAEVQRRIDSLGALFVEAVASGRGLDVESAEKLHTGQVWIGRQAVEVGLVDRVARFDDLMIELSQPQTTEDVMNDETTTPDAAETPDEQGFVQRVTNSVLQALGLAQPLPQNTASAGQDSNLLTDAQNFGQLGAQLRKRQAELDVDARLKDLGSRVTPATESQLREVLLKLHQSDAEGFAQLVGALGQLPDMQLFDGEMADETTSGEPRLPSSLSTSEREYLKSRGVDEARDQELGHKYRAAYGAMG